MEGFNPNKTFGVADRSKMGIFVGVLDNGKGKTETKDGTKF